MSFQKTVSMIFFIILIIFLVIIGVTLYNAKLKNPTYPPKISQCPDYWTLDNNNKCINTNNLGNSSCTQSINLSDSVWNNKDSHCNKYKWAKSCGLTWDGITNVGLNCNN